jgi:hypothetical protein
VFILLFRGQNAGQNFNIQMCNKSLENLENLKYLGKKYQIKIRFKNLILSCCLLSENVNIKILDITASPVALCKYET